jgi:hypothetical protein
MFLLRSKLILGVGIAIGMAGLAAQAQPQPGRRPPGPRPGQNSGLASQQEAGEAVQRAYDALGRSTVLSQTASRGTTEILSQGRDAYQQALSQYQASNFVGARETAMTAADLARAAEQITTANLLEASARQTQLPAPPTGSAAAVQTARAYQDLARVSEHSARLAAALSAQPAISSAIQIRPLLARSARLQQRAQSLLTANKPEEATAMARASDALLAAADHVEQRALIASGTIPTPPPPPNGATPPPPPPDAGPPPPAADPNGPVPPPPPPQP